MMRINGLPVLAHGVLAARHVRGFVAYREAGRLCFAPERDAFYSISGEGL